MIVEPKEIFDIAKLCNIKINLNSLKIYYYISTNNSSFFSKTYLYQYLIFSEMDIIENQYLCKDKTYNFCYDMYGNDITKSQFQILDKEFLVSQKFWFDSKKENKFDYELDIEGTYDKLIKYINIL